MSKGAADVSSAAGDFFFGGAQKLSPGARLFWG